MRGPEAIHRSPVQIRLRGSLFLLTLHPKDKNVCPACTMHLVFYVPLPVSAYLSTYTSARCICVLVGADRDGQCGFDALQLVDGGWMNLCWWCWGPDKSHEASFHPPPHIETPRLGDPSNIASPCLFDVQSSPAPICVPNDLLSSRTSERWERGTCSYLFWGYLIQPSQPCRCVFM